MTDTSHNEAKLLHAKALGNLLGLSQRTVFRLNAAGKIPAPMRVGGSVRWLFTEITAWLNNGAVDRKTWECMKGAQGGKL